MSKKPTPADSSPQSDLFGVPPEATPLRPAAPPAPAPSNVRWIRFDRPPASQSKAGGPGVDSPKRTRRWGQATEALLAVLKARFEHLGVPTSTADGYARNALLALAEYAGGRDFYLPRAVLLKAAIRDAEIRREFNGRNYVELAAKHQLTVAHVRRIIKARSRTTKAPPHS